MADKELTEREARFVAHANFMFQWEDCKALLNDEDTKDVVEDGISLEEAIRLIEEEGYTPIPF